MLLGDVSKLKCPLPEGVASMTTSAKAAFGKIMLPMTTSAIVSRGQTSKITRLETIENFTIDFPPSKPVLVLTVTLIADRGGAGQAAPRRVIPQSKRRLQCASHGISFPAIGRDS